MVQLIEAIVQSAKGEIDVEEEEESENTCAIFSKCSTSISGYNIIMYLLLSQYMHVHLVKW